MTRRGIVVHTVAGACLALAAAAETTIHATSRHAYAANVGWIDWRGDVTNGASIGEYVCSGYVHSANCGWICLGNGAPTNGIRYGNDSAEDYGVNVEGGGNLCGYAYGANIGWVRFGTNGNPRVELTTGKLSGFAYGANVGWIGLSNLHAYVQTEWFARGGDSDEDGIPDAWEREQGATPGTGGLARDRDTDGDGHTDYEEYVADTDPLGAEDRLRITGLFRNGDTQVSLRWTSRQTRLYGIDRTDRLDASPKWHDSGPGLRQADPGNSTSRTVPAARETISLFRVRAVLPLPPPP